MASRPDRKVKNAKKSIAKLAAARDRKEAGGKARPDFDVSTIFMT